MNEFLQNNLITIIVFLLLIILVLIGLIGFVLVRLLLQKENKPQPVVVAPVVQEPIIVNTKKSHLAKYVEEPVVEKYFCNNHPEAQSIGSCLICEDVYCEKCLVEHEGLYFCKEHFKIFANNKWQQITDVKTTPDTPIDGLYVYHFKRKIWKENNVPAYILTHYKINIENDFIESFIQLYVREQEADKLSNDISFFQNQA